MKDHGIAADFCGAESVATHFSNAIGNYSPCFVDALILGASLRPSANLCDGMSLCHRMLSPHWRCSLPAVLVPYEVWAHQTLSPHRHGSGLSMVGDIDEMNAHSASSVCAAAQVRLCDGRDVFCGGAL